MHMELRVLDYFLAVAELGTVSAAASRCYVSQPAISRQLVALERDLGAVLFDRTSAGLRLNAAGGHFYPIARDLRRRLSQGTDVMRSLRSGTLALVAACPLTTMEYIVAPFIAAGHPSIADVRTFTPDRVYEQLEQGTADFAVGTKHPPSRYESEPLVDSGLTVQFPAGHPRFTADERIDLSRLEQERVLIPGAGSAISQAVSSAEIEQGLSLKDRTTVSSATVAQALAASGEGCAVVVEPAGFGLDRAYLCAGDQQLLISLYAAWEPDHYAAVEIAALVADLRQWAAQRPNNIVGSS